MFEDYAILKENLLAFTEQSRKVFENTGNKNAVKTIETLTGELSNLRYSITIVGSFNSGKSTLLNVLMERKNDNISPISFEPCTSAIIKYFDKDLTEEKKECAIVYYEDDKSPEKISLSEIKNYVVEKYNKDNFKKIRTVEVYGDFPKWSKAATIIDSPGQNSINKHHDVLLRDHLPYTDAIIFVVPADLPLTGSDIQLLKELSKEEKKKIFFVLTKIDTMDDEEDKQEVIEYAEETIKKVLSDNKIELEDIRVFPTAALPVYKALCSGASKEKINSLKRDFGVKEFELKLEEFIKENSDSTKIFADRSKSLVRYILSTSKQFIDINRELLNNNNFDIAKLEADKQNLETNNKELQKETKKAIERFEKKWERSVSAFERNLKGKLPQLNDQIAEKIKRAGFVTVLQNSFKLKEIIGNELQCAINDNTTRLEDKLDELVTDLNKDIETELAIYVKKNGASIDPVSGVTATGSLLAMGTAAVYGASSLAGSVTAITSAVNTMYTTGVLSKWCSILTGYGAYSVAEGTLISASLVAVTNVVTIGAAVWLAKKLVHCGVTEIQIGRISTISEECFNEMILNVINNLNNYKSSIIKEYKTIIENIIAENTEKYNELCEMISNHDQEKFELLKKQVESVEMLVNNNSNITMLIAAM